MRSLLRTIAVLGLLSSTLAFAAPSLRLELEGEEDYAVFAPKQWVDLIVNVDPKGAPLAADQLGVTAAGDAGVEVGAPIFPAPDAEGVYGRKFQIRIPVRPADAEEHQVTVKVAGMEASKTFSAETLTSGHITGKASLRTEPAVAGEPNAVVLDLEILEGYHVYGTMGAEKGLPLVARLLPAPGTPAVTVWLGGGPTSPQDEEYFGAFRFEIPFTPVRAGENALRVLVSWQACTDMVCDPNEFTYLPLEFEVRAGERPVDVAETPPAETPQEDGLATIGLIELILLSIGAGLFALAMPCTYPLIPITISFFTKQAEHRHGSVLPLALAYGGGIIAIFILIGLAVGAPIVEFATLWWVNALFALLFLVFGLSLIGLFEIRPPAFLMNAASKTSGTGGYFSVFAMGTTLVITSFTCTAPFVGSLLVLAGEGGDLGKVGLSMGVFGLTMAIPFVLLSLSPKAMQSLPRSGEWMKTLKVTLGIVELGLVLKFLSNVDLARGWFLIGRELFLALWGASFLVAGLYLIGFFSLFVPGAKWAVGKGRVIAAVFMFAVTAYLAGGLGGKPLWENLEAFLPVLPEQEGTYSRGFLAVVHEDYERGLVEAQALDAPAFVHFTGFQ